MIQGLVHFPPAPCQNDLVDGGPPSLPRAKSGAIAANDSMPKGQHGTKNNHHDSKLILVAIFP